MLTLGKKIAAVVLSVDHNRPFAENMILAYQDLWPNHPLHFFLPYQKNQTLDPRIDSASVTLVRTEPEIKQTVLTLLSQFDQEDMVFWSIDDKFPQRIDTGILKSIFDSVGGSTFDVKFDGLLFTRARSLVSYPGIQKSEKEILGIPAYEVLTNKQFWLHQLVRVRRLRQLFESMPSIARAKDMDLHIPSLEPPIARFVLKRTALVFDESSRRGIPTLAAIESLQRREIFSPFEEGGKTAAMRSIGRPNMEETIQIFRHDLRASIRKHWPSRFGDRAEG